MPDLTLHEDIAKLAGEIHDLSEKFSAKEVLATKAKELAEEAADITGKYRILVWVIAGLLLIVIAGLIWTGVVASANRELGSCQARFNKANELRSTVLTDYTMKQNDAMKDLVKARGLPNDEAIIAARDRWLEADWLLSEARRLNPVLKYEDFCKNVPGVDPPKVPPANLPDQSLYPGSQIPAQ